ncbi:MAG TPA: PhzF family phenazine biosynthesis protein [Acidimicrobiales bacterium]|nr:PhzF family phenazine biosynthesis protein [Acidimicrobiales bacterium]
MNAPRTRPFMQVDVFTEEGYFGNPVGVVLDAEGLSEAEMQRITSWANLSETTFVLPPTVDQADYRVRIFSPMGELPFAGHPTLGTAHAWLASSRAGRGDGRTSLIQECSAGLVELRRSDGRLAFAAPALVRSGAVDEATVGELRSMLNVERAVVMAAEWVDNGPGWAALLLPDAGAVLAVKPGRVDRCVGVVGLYPAGSEVACEVRAFFPKDGTTVEDPVTGSLNASLGQWLIGSGRLGESYVAAQGTALGRRGRVYVERAADGRLWVGGGTVTCIAGEIRA